MSKQTPGPWRVIASADREIYVSSAEQNIARIAYPKNTGQANAEFIVRACNSHEELLEALQYASELIATARRYFPKSIKNADRFYLEHTCAAIGAAIAKAEGGI